MNYKTVLLIVIVVAGVCSASVSTNPRDIKEADWIPISYEKLFPNSIGFVIHPDPVLKPLPSRDYTIKFQAPVTSINPFEWKKQAFYIEDFGWGENRIRPAVLEFRNQRVGKISPTTETAVVPEPGTLLLSSIGLSIVGYLKRRKSL